MTADELDTALRVNRQLGLGAVVASLIEHERQAAATLRIRLLRSVDCPPAKLWRAYNHYQSTVWPQKKTAVRNPHPRGLEHVLWEVLKLQDKNIGERHMRRLLERL